MFLGTFFVETTTRIYITSANFTASLHREYCTFVLWTFTAPYDSRIVMTFSEFDLEESTEVIEIGDGTDYRNDTRMAIFSGNDLPSNVTSVSCGAWIMFRYHLDRCCRNPTIEFSVSAVNKSGISKNNDLFFIFLYSLLQQVVKYFNPILFCAYKL